MVTISTLELIEANRKALDAGTLGSQKHTGEAMYRYPDDCRCALGAAMDIETLGRIEAKGLNEHSLDDLLASGLVTFTDYMPARWLQSMHDAWVTGVRAPGSSYEAPDALRPFLNRFVCNRKVTEETYRKFLDLLEDTYCGGDEPSTH